MITIRGNLKTGEWIEIARQADPRDVTIDQAASALARLITKGGAENGNYSNDGPAPARI